MGPEVTAERVVARFLEGYKRPDNMIPVWNKVKEHTVYVLPETVQESGGVYTPLPDSKLDTEGKPAPFKHPGQPHLPKKPKKPHKPQIYRVPPPAPVHPPIPPIERKPLPPRKPRRVHRVKPPKVPEPPKHEKHKRVRRYLQADDASPERVVQKFLDRLVSFGV